MKDKMHSIQLDNHNEIETSCEKHNRELLAKVAGRLSGFHKDSLSTAEKQIVNILIDACFLFRDKDGNIIDADALPNIKPGDLLDE